MIGWKPSRHGQQRQDAEHAGHTRSAAGAGRVVEPSSACTPMAARAAALNDTRKKIIEGTRVLLMPGRRAYGIW